MFRVCSYGANVAHLLARSLTKVAFGKQCVYGRRFALCAQLKAPQGDVKSQLQYGLTGCGVNRATPRRICVVCNDAMSTVGVPHSLMGPSICTLMCVSVLQPAGPL